MPIRDITCTNGRVHCQLDQGNSINKINPFPCGHHFATRRQNEGEGKINGSLFGINRELVSPTTLNRNNIMRFECSTIRSSHQKIGSWR